MSRPRVRSLVAVLAATVVALGAANTAGAAPLGGTSSYSWSGEGSSAPTSAVVAGDVNGDGKDDLAFGQGDTVTILYGAAWAASLDLDRWLGVRGVRLTLPENALLDLQPAGDFDGDGRDDLAITTPSRVFVFHGAEDELTGTVPLTGIGRTTEISLTGGYRGLGIGDFDGDGRDDLAINRTIGAAVVYGGPRGETVDGNVKDDRTSSITPTRSCRFVLVIPVCSNNQVILSVIGDFNGDGRAELGLENGATDGTGKQWVLFGRPGTFVTGAGTPANAMEVPEGFWTGNATSLASGAGDVNGDGFDDLAPIAVTTGATTTAIRFVLGSASPPKKLDPLTAPALRVDGAVAGVRIGDQSGDGRSDLVVSTGSGLLDQRVLPVPRGATALDGRSGTLIGGIPSAGYLGVSAGAGDFDGDGSADLVLTRGPQRIGGVQRFYVATQGRDIGAPAAVEARLSALRFTAAQGTAVTVVSEEAVRLDLTYRREGESVGTERRQASAGESRFTFDGSVGGTRLPAGMYTLDLVPVDAAGNRGRARIVAFELLPDTTAAPATLTVKTVVQQEGGLPALYPPASVRYSATCGGWTFPRGSALATNADIPIGDPSAGLRAGENCQIGAQVELDPGSPLRRCSSWQDDYTFNGAPATASGSVRLRAGENAWVLRRTCSFAGTDLPTSLADFTVSGVAMEVDPLGVLQLTDAIGGRLGTAVFEPRRDLNGRTIEFEARMTGGNGSAEGLTLAFLTGYPDALGAYVGGPGQKLAFGDLPGIALALDVSQGPNDPSGNFIGWTDGTSGSGLRWLQTANPGVALRSGAWVKIKVALTGGTAKVSVNGTLRMERAMTVPTAARLAFTAATNDRTWQTHSIRGLKIS